MANGWRCYACDRPIRGNRHPTFTSDGQTQHIGIECARRVYKSRSEGYQPPKGGPRLYAFAVQEAK